MKRDTTTAFGAAVRQHRRRAGLTQADIAERAELAVESVSRIETGRLANITLNVAKRLADALGVDVATLLSEKRRTNPVRRAAESRALALLAPLSNDDAEAVVGALGVLLRVREKAG